MTRPEKAAFFRVEGTLVQRGAFQLAAYLAANGQGFAERLIRLGQVALASPAARLVGGTDGALAARLTYLPLRGMSEDRIEILAGEYFDDVLRKSVLSEGVELVRRAAQDGMRCVLLAETVAPVTDRLAAHLDLDAEWISNRLEIHRGNATGTLLDPVLSGHSLAAWIRGWAAEHNVDLERCRAYAASASDLTLLSAVGEPCAVNPDFLLRRAARDARWPILDLDSVGGRS